MVEGAELVQPPDVLLISQRPRLALVRQVRCQPVAADRDCEAAVARSVVSQVVSQRVDDRQETRNELGTARACLGVRRAPASRGLGASGSTSTTRCRVGRSAMWQLERRRCGSPSSPLQRGCRSRSALRGQCHVQRSQQRTVVVPVTRKSVDSGTPETLRIVSRARRRLDQLRYLGP